MIRLDVIAPGARGILARPRRAGGAGLGSVTSDYYAQLQGKMSGLSAQGAATIQANTGVDVTQPRVAQGAAAALSLAQNGFDPNSAADEQKLVAAIAGGCCLIPVVGPAIGAAVEVLYQTLNAVGCPMLKVAADLGLGALPPACGGQACATSGNWTMASILTANAQSLPHRPSGSFPEFAVAALAQYAAQGANCKATLPPGVVVDAAVAVWNQTHAGPAAAVLVPPLNMLGGMGGPSIIAAWQSGNDPYTTWAFYPVASISSADHPNPHPSSPGLLWPVAPAIGQTGATFWQTTPDSSWSVDPPRVVMVNQGAALPQVDAAAQARAALNQANAATAVWQAQEATAAWQAQEAQGAAQVAAKQSTAKTVAIVAGASVATVAVAGSVWALVQKQALGYFWGKVFDRVIDGGKSLYHRAAG